MCCIPMERGGQIVGHICRPDGRKEAIRKRRRRLWCFKCRNYTMHMLMAFRLVQPAYYEDPIWYECPTCGEDHTSFPGF
jgi:hypothetical protein